MSVIYGNIYHQYTPVMLAYMPAPWILWVLYQFILWISRYPPCSDASLPCSVPGSAVSRATLHDFAATVTCGVRWLSEFSSR